MTQIRSLSGILLLLAAACGNPVTTPRAATATTVPSPPVAAASPALSVSASPSPQSYTCTDMSGGGGARANVVAVRAAAQDGSGRSVTLDGAAGVVLRLQPASSGAQAPRAMSPRETELRDLRQVGDFEGVVHWAAGLAAPACTHVTTLDGPPRLVIDFKTGE